ncbi:MAG: alpha-xylosidase, partial [Oscillospiraceae bacterium]|nr:alpha-xylosidase [Oscillospiraceae bacterium]
IADFYLPVGGEWTDIQTGEKLMGGSWYQKKYDYFGLPLYAKPGSIIPMGDFVRDVEYDYLTNATFRIFGLEDGKSASRKIYDKEANEIFEITAVRNGDEIALSFTKTDSAFKAQVDDKVFDIPAGCDSYKIKL